MTETAIFDGDYCTYSCAAIAEQRSVLVVHKQTGREKEFANQTEFFGRGKEVGGWLGEVNKKRTSPFTKEEFEIIQQQKPIDVAHALHAAKTQIQTAVNMSGADRFHGFVGFGDCFRVERSTLQKYKGGRETLLRPLFLDNVKEYLIKKYKFEPTTYYEADDMCVMSCYGKKDHFVVAIDKDTGGCPVRWFNPDYSERGIVDCNKYGELFIKPNGKDVGGIGRIFLWFQILVGDITDTYNPWLYADKSIGQKSAYKLLSECKTDKEALQLIVDKYKELYPEPKVVKSWKGEDITITWDYILQEIFTMARMVRKEGEENMLVKDVLDKLGIVY